MLLHTMSWKDAENLITPKILAVIPLGSLEQHGPIGPLGTDFIIPEELAKRIDQSHTDDVVTLPVMPYGVCGHHMDFPGTVDIGYDGLFTVMSNVASSLMHHGIRKFVFLNGHGGNGPALDAVALEISRRSGIAAILDWWVLAGQLDPRWVGGHGGGQETSMVMAIHPEWVHPERCFPATIGHLSEKLRNIHISQVRFGKGTIRIPRNVRDVTSTGAYGGPDDPESASATWGQEMLEAVSAYMNDFISEFIQVPLP